MFPENDFCLLYAALFFFFISAEIRMLSNHICYYMRSLKTNREKKKKKTTPENPPQNPKYFGVVCFLALAMEIIT